MKEVSPQRSSKMGGHIVFLYSLIIPLLLVLGITMAGIALVGMESTLKASPFTLLNWSCTEDRCDLVFLNNSYSLNHLPLSGVAEKASKLQPILPPFLRLLTNAADAISDGTSILCDMIFDYSS